MAKPMFKTLCQQAQGEIDMHIAALEATLALIKNPDNKASEFFASGMRLRMEEASLDGGFVREILRDYDGRMLGSYLENIKAHKPSKYIDALYNAYLQNPEFAHRMFTEGYDYECAFLSREDDDSDALVAQAPDTSVSQTVPEVSASVRIKSMHEMVEDALRGIQRDTNHLIAFINNTDYFEVRSSSHDHWKGGMAQHAFRAYSYAMYIYDELKKNGSKDVALINRDSLALVTLMHDICNITSHQFKSGHGRRSRSILESWSTGAIATEPELKAVECHRHDTDKLILCNDQYKEETLQLHRILRITDQLSAGTAWNTTRFKDGLNQNKSNKGLYREAFERTWQCLVPGSWLKNHGIKEGMYLDCHYHLQHIGTGDVDFDINDPFSHSTSNVVKLYPQAGDDIISLAHRLVLEGKKPLLVIGYKQESPDIIDKMRNGSERDFLICSNVAPALFDRKCKQDSYTYTMKKHAKDFITDVKGSPTMYIIVRNVEFFRLGHSNNYQMVEPWPCEVALDVRSTDSYIVEDVPQSKFEIDPVPSYNREYTPGKITSLKKNEIFVFGRNIRGQHGAGAAQDAYQYFGAEWGVGEGLTGQSYALPTMEGGVDYIEGKVKMFLRYAKSHTEYQFLVTPIACGIAGFKLEEIAPLFKDAITLQNVILPKSFVEILEGQRQS